LSKTARFADRSFLTQFAVLSLLCAVSGFFGSTFTSSPSTTIEARYAYLLARTAIAALIVLMIYSVHQFSIRPESVAINAPLKPKVIDPLLTLRGFAFVMVFMGHYFRIAFPVADLSQALERQPLMGLLTTAPWAGVWIFFTLSGYLIGKGFFTGRHLAERTGIAKYVTNRALRIVPLYVFALVFISLLQYQDILKPTYIWILIQMLIFDYKGDMPINPIGDLWTISTEFQFYLVAPFVYLLMRLAHKKASLPLLMIVLVAGFAARYAALSANGAAWYSFVYTPFLTNLDLFLSGMLLSKVLAESKSHLFSIRHRDVFLPIGLFVIAAFYVEISVFPKLSGIVGSGVAAAISFWETITCISALLVIALFEAADVPSAKDRWSLAYWITAKTQILGILTYSLYVFSAPVLLSMRKIAPPTLSLPDSLTYFLPVCFLLFAISFTLYQFLERPFEKLKF
jgi:peptidoglycan/LPS O-acetylase OafA/YrhL